MMGVSSEMMDGAGQRNGKTPERAMNGDGRLDHNKKRCRE
jgi:hypothetical protein